MTAGQAHVDAIMHPRTVEEEVVNLTRWVIRYVGRMESQYGHPWDDYVLGSGVGQIIEGIRVLLNGDIGRLDAATMDRLLCETAESVGWDIDRSEWVGSEAVTRR